VARKKQQESTDPDGPPSYEDEITSTVSLHSVTGRSLTEIIASAKIRAAKALETQPVNIYIISNSALTPAATARFEPGEPILWSASLICGIVPLDLRM
jgi:exosome complex RNA-binding protein Rrp42 (RNase PH superfamily)